MILDYNINDIKKSAKLLRELADFYFAQYGRPMKLGCGTCYDKIFIELKSKIMEDKTIKLKEKCNFTLKVSNIREFGSGNCYTNATLTNEVAIAYIKVNGQRLQQFSEYPKNIKELLEPKTNEIKKAEAKVVKEEKEVKTAKAKVLKEEKDVAKAKKDLKKVQAKK